MHALSMKSITWCLVRRLHLHMATTGSNDVLVTLGQRPPHVVKTAGLRDNPAKVSKKKQKVTQQQGRFK
jgi:hypothetical protein